MCVFSLWYFFFLIEKASPYFAWGNCCQRSFSVWKMCESDLIIHLNSWGPVANNPSITQSAASDRRELLAMPGPSSPPLPSWAFHLEREREKNQAEGINWHLSLPRGMRSKAFLQVDEQTWSESSRQVVPLVLAHMDQFMERSWNSCWQTLQP